MRFLGERPDAKRLVAAADLFVQPNLRPEAFGISFIEALAAGVPVISTALGGANEIITPECGILVAPNDPRALERSLRTLILDVEMRQRLGRAGPSRARQLCDVPQQLLVLERLFARHFAHSTEGPNK